jgi:hypothetical protein
MVDNRASCREATGDTMSRSLQPSAASSQRGLGAIREQGGLTYAEDTLAADFVFRPAAIARDIAWLGRDRSLGAGLRRVGAAHAPDVRHILRLPTDDREVLRAEQQSLATVAAESGTMAQRDVRDRHGRYNVLTVRPYRAPLQECNR